MRGQSLSKCVELQLFYCMSRLLWLCIQALPFSFYLRLLEWACWVVGLEEK